jgi:hypothetical protein
MSPRHHLGLVPVLALALLACGAPIAVERVDPRTVHRGLTASVLSVGTASTASQNVLSRWYLTERFARDPEVTLARMHTTVAEERAGADEIFALAERSSSRPPRSPTR